MCGIHNHDRAEGHANGQCGHCSHDELTLEEFKDRRDQLNQDIAPREQRGHQNVIPSGPLVRRPTRTVAALPTHPMEEP